MKGNDRQQNERSSGSLVAKLPSNVHSFASQQGGHITREQLLAAGLNARTIVRWTETGKLIRVYRGVYAVGHLQTNPISAAHAALLAGGPRCALAGSPALVLHGIWKRWPKQLEIVTAGDRRPSGLTVHHSTTLLSRDITSVQKLRVTSPARTLLDTAERLSEQQLTRAVNDLRLRNLLTLEQLQDVLDRNPTHAAVTLLTPHLEHAQAEPTRSWLEDVFLPLLRKHGLPTPTINIPLAGHRIDAYFADHALVVELDGWGSHRFKHKFLSDRRQDFDILLRLGVSTVRLPYEDVDDATIVKLKQLLTQRTGMGLATARQSAA
jgi:hypothetical protein